MNKRRPLPPLPEVTYKKQRLCYYCMAPGTVLDAKRTLNMSQDRADAIYLCKRCFEREYPELIPEKPLAPDIPVFGAQYIGGIRSKPNVARSRKRWRLA